MLSGCISSNFVFFFQAEDGIRDVAVTGVQTCALPIYVTTYTRALATLARARLSRRNAADADSLLKMAQLRREVGDVSELDVRLAAVNAGQLENGAADDSLAAVEALLAVQLAMALPGEQPTITLADSLAPPSDSIPSLGAEPLPVAAAAASLRSEQRALTLAHRSVFAAPSLQVGVENVDPTQGGALPTIGLSLPLPLFNWNGGEVARADRESVVEGKRVDLGGRRIIKKKKKQSEKQDR